MIKKYCKRSLVVLSGAALVFVLSLAGGSSTSLKSEFAGELPSINDVFVNLFAGFVLQAEEAQLKSLIDEKLTEDEKIAIRNFLGDEGVARLRAMASAAPEKEAMLTPLDKEYAGKQTSLTFKDAFPRIDAKVVNIMTTQQVNDLFSKLDGKEIGTLCMFMGNEGLAVLFNDIPSEKAEAILNNTPDWLLLEMGKKKLATMNTYESIVYKQEIVDGEQQGVEKMLLKFRHKPWALYMKWIDGPFTGRECLFNEQTSTEDVRVRESGILGIIAVDVPLTSSLARRGSNHTPTEMGIFYLLGMIEKDYRKAAPLGHIQRKSLGIQDLGGHKVYVMESILPRDPTKGYYCWRLKHYIDYKRSLLIKAEIFNFEDKMSEMYYYTEIKFNPPYTDADFSPDFPEYDL